MRELLITFLLCTTGLSAYAMTAADVDKAKDLIEQEKSLTQDLDLMKNPDVRYTISFYTSGQDTFLCNSTPLPGYWSKDSKGKDTYFCLYKETRTMREVLPGLVEGTKFKLKEIRASLKELGVSGYTDQCDNDLKKGK